MSISHRSIKLCFIISPVQTSDTIFWKINYDNWWCIWQLKSEQSRHTVSDLSQIPIQFCCNICPLKQLTLRVQ